jgi:hypothetical protein
MVISNRGETAAQTNKLIAENAVKTYDGYDYYFGLDMIDAARNSLGYDIDQLDADDAATKFPEIIAEVNKNKARLTELIKLKQAHKVADFFVSRKFSFVRFDQGLDLEQASQLAINDKDEGMYFDPLPSAMYKLVKHFYPDHIFHDEAEATLVDDQVVSAIQSVRPSVMIRTSEEYFENQQRLSQEYMRVFTNTKEQFTQLDYEIFRDILSEAEFQDLQTSVRARLTDMPLLFVDPLLSDQADTRGYYSRPFFATGYTDSDVISIITHPVGNDSKEELVIHELAHSVLEGMRFSLKGGLVPVLKTAGLTPLTNPPSKDNNYVWLNEAFTASLTHYLLSRLHGNQVTFGRDFVAELVRTGADLGYPDEIKLLLQLEKAGAINLTDGLRVYLGFPYRGEKTVSVGRLLNGVNQGLAEKYQLKVADLDTIYRSTKPENFPMLLHLSAGIVKQAKAGQLIVQTAPDGKLDLMSYFRQYNFDPQEIALNMMPAEERRLFEALGLLASITVNGEPLTPYMLLELRKQIDPLEY